MPNPYPPEFRALAIAPVHASKQVNSTPYELGICAGCLHNWLSRTASTAARSSATSEAPELRAACKWIRELEIELAIIREVTTFLGENKPHPEGVTR